jgi:hypothetical protein
MQPAIQRLLLIASVVGGSIFWQQQSLATVIVDRPWTGNINQPSSGPINGVDSSVTGQQVAEDFVMPTTAIIRSLQWYGVGINGALDGVYTEDFQIRFYADTPNSPGQPKTLDHSPALYQFYTLDVVATLQYTGQSDFYPPGRELSLYSFEANLYSPVFLIAGETYWLSILGNDSTEFEWADGGVGADVFRPGGQGNGSPWLESVDETYSAFALSDTPIPEPSSFVTLATSLALALCALRARLMMSAQDRNVTLRAK